MYDLPTQLNTNVCPTATKCLHVKALEPNVTTQRLVYILDVEFLYTNYRVYIY